MPRLFFSTILISLMIGSFSIPAGAKKVPKAPDLACLKQPVYKNVVGKITRISTPIRIKDNSFDGWKYNYSYIFPNGYKGSGYTVFPKKTLKANIDDYFLWVPANKAVINLDPSKNSQVPLIVSQFTCSSYQVDWSSPAKEIPGI
jgi:hypothetical protein